MQLQDEQSFHVPPCRLNTDHIRSEIAELFQEYGMTSGFNLEWIFDRVEEQRV